MIYDHSVNPPFHDKQTYSKLVISGVRTFLEAVATISNRTRTLVDAFGTLSLLFNDTFFE